MLNKPLLLSLSSQTGSHSDDTHPPTKRPAFCISTDAGKLFIWRNDTREAFFVMMLWWRCAALFPVFLTLPFQSSALSHTVVFGEKAHLYPLLWEAGVCSNIPTVVHCWPLPMHFTSAALHTFYYLVIWQVHDSDHCSFNVQVNRL